MKVKYFASAEETALNILRDYIIPGTQESSGYHVALSGGATPELLFALMARPEYIHLINWDHLHLYWVDERMVDPENPQSNYGMAKRIILDHVPLTPDRIHRIIGESEDAEDEANRYALEVLRSLSPQNSQRRWLADQPNVNNSIQQAHFDLVLLGIGEDGHTASIYPEVIELVNAKPLYVTSKHPVTGQQRVGLSGSGICSAVHIVFLATGPAKAAVLKEIVNNTMQAQAYPAMQICNKRPDSILYTDSISPSNY